jgi:hypothetical protein
VHDEIAVVGQYPLGVFIAFQAQRRSSGLLQFQARCIADGLNLA